MEIGPKTRPVGHSHPQGLPPRALGAKFARVSFVLQIFSDNAYSTAPVRGSCLCVRARLRRVGPEPTKRNLPRARRWAQLFRERMQSVSRSVAQQKRCRAARVPPQGAGVVQGVAGPWDCGAGFVSDSVGVAVGPYQAQVREPSESARVHPREDGIVQAVVGTCGQAAGLP